MEELIRDILSKKELQNLDVSTAREFLARFFKKNPKLKERIEKKGYNKKSSEYRKALKEIRKELREIYGVFVEESQAVRRKLLKEDDFEGLLKSHTSTRERLPYYDEVYQKIFSITGKPKSILDLACGLNPLSYKYMGCSPRYLASDISQKDMDLIQEFFDKEGIDGKSIKIDLVTEQEKLKGLKCDVCFMFKALDSLEVRKRQVSKSLIPKLESRWIVISFSKISLGGKKPIKRSKRQWIINFLEKNSYHHHIFETENEIFIVVKQKK